MYAIPKALVSSRIFRATPGTDADVSLTDVGQ
jgi:hypothetical protein